MLITPLSYLLVTSFNQDVVSHSSCLSNSLYGIFDGGKIGVFIVTPQCLDTVRDVIPMATVTPVPVNIHEQNLVWLEPEHVEEAAFHRYFAPVQDDDEDDTRHPDGQTVFSVPDSHQAVASGLLYQSGHRKLFALDSASTERLESTIDPIWRMTTLPKESINFVPVPKDAVDRVRKLAKQLHFDPVVASLVNNISVHDMEKDIRWLTGEDKESPIVSRHSFGEGSRIAAKWLKDNFERTGASCQLKDFLIGFAPNVVCRYTGTANTTATVLISAHYDSRGSFGSTRAPGANDDGSGTTALLAIAKTIGRKGVRFESNVELVAFAGEEQGLYGSRGYSRELRQQNANLTLMIQADMLAYHAPGEPPQLGLPDIIGTPEVTSYVANISAIYSPELVVGFTPACCSDHQSFHEQGFPATQVYERAGPIADPMYHNSGDLSARENFDLNQVRSIAKVQFATLLHSAGYSLIKEDDKY